MRLPNVLTVSRFGMAILLMICLSVTFQGTRIAALILFIVAALTDAFDGHLARKVYGCTDFGRLMDPLADKVLTVAAFIGFVEMRILPAWMVTLIISREMMVTGLRLLAANKGVVLAAGMLGKQKTIGQMIFIIAVLLTSVFHGLENFSALFFWAGLSITILTVWSGFIYFWGNMNLLKTN